MALQIAYGAIEAISVTVRDTTGYISDLGTAYPHFSVYSVDEDTDADDVLMVDEKDATSSGMTVNCLIETKYGVRVGQIGSAVADNPPTMTFPVTVIAGVNDQYLISTIFFGMQLIPPGTYNNITEYAAAMSLALGQFDYGYSYGYTITDSLGGFSYDPTLGKMRFIATTQDEAWNGLTISNGTHDGLAGTGWTSGQVVYENAIASSGKYKYADPQLVPGKYRLYIEFTSGTFVVPRVGPVDFYII